MSQNSDIIIVKANPERKIIRPVKNVNRIPPEILLDSRLNEAIKSLPKNYDFEILKTIWRIKMLNAQRVALQMPEGLFMFALTICDIIEEFTDAETIILGDVTYGACCIDDLSAKSFNVDLLIHYGHSCLVPIDTTLTMKFLYVFVDIKINIQHFVDTVCYNFSLNNTLALISTVQFLSSLHDAYTILQKKKFTVKVPQIKPLSQGEILGCTSPKIVNVDAVIYLGDGRFHLESAMIANPAVKFFRYDPYQKTLTEQFYNHEIMLKSRKSAIEKARSTYKIGVILSILGRQGSTKILKRLQEIFSSLTSKKYAIVLLSEISPQKLELFRNTVDSWIQIACPRLSIDWHNSFKKPLLTAVEGHLMLSNKSWFSDDSDYYPMEYYAHKSSNIWISK